MQKDMNKIFDTTQKELENEVENSKQMVSNSAKQLMKIKKNITIDTAITPEMSAEDQSLKPTQESQSKIFDVDDWEIEYDKKLHLGGASCSFTINLKLSYS